MKSRNTILAAIVAASIFPLFVLQTHARPRPPQPPWPEPTLRIYGFDAAYQRGPWKDIAINEEDSVAESWSGYSLVREGVVVSPVVIPVDVESKRPNYKLDSGAIRFWFAPNWTSSNSKEGGRGPGHLASLVELVSLDEKKPAVKWSLCVNESGDTIYLAGESKAGTTIYLKAPVQFEAGDWRMITLGYSGTNTALWLDGELVAKGEGLPARDWWETKNLGLVVGSDIYANGKSLAEGQFEELTTFASWPKKSDWQDFYFKSGKRRSFLGAVGTKEEEQMKLAVLREAGLIPEEETSSMKMMSLEEGGANAAYSYAAGLLWLEITGVSNNLAHLIVHGTV